MTQETDEREAFENWLKNNTRYIPDFYPKERKYVDRFVCLLWECWLARARAGKGEDAEQKLEDAAYRVHGISNSVVDLGDALSIMRAAQAKPAEVGVLAKIIAKAWSGDIDMSFSDCVDASAQAILERFNVTEK